MKLGTYLKAAIFVASSRKGPWHLARNLATQTGMTNQWLKEQEASLKLRPSGGLLSVKKLWVYSVEQGSLREIQQGEYLSRRSS